MGQNTISFNKTMSLDKPTSFNKTMSLDKPMPHPHQPRDCVLYAESVRLQSKLMFDNTANKFAIKAESELMDELSSWLAQLNCADVDDKKKSNKRMTKSAKRNSASINTVSISTHSRQK